MPADPSSKGAASPRPNQFSLGRLFVVMTFASLACVAFRYSLPGGALALVATLLAFAFAGLRTIALQALMIIFGLAAFAITAYFATR